MVGLSTTFLLMAVCLKILVSMVVILLFVHTTYTNNINNKRKEKKKEMNTRNKNIFSLFAFKSQLPAHLRAFAQLAVLVSIEFKTMN